MRASKDTVTRFFRRLEIEMANPWFSLPLSTASIGLYCPLLIGGELLTLISADSSLGTTFAFWSANFRDSPPISRFLGCVNLPDRCSKARIRNDLFLCTREHTKYIVIFDWKLALEGATPFRYYCLRYLSPQVSVYRSLCWSISNRGSLALGERTPTTTYVTSVCSKTAISWQWILLHYGFNCSVRRSFSLSIPSINRFRESLPRRSGNTCTNRPNRRVSLLFSSTPFGASRIFLPIARYPGQLQR